MNSNVKVGSPLTPREEEVVREICKGKTNIEVAETLGVIEKTVKFHLTNIFKKMAVTSRSQLILKSLREGREKCS